MYLPLNRQTASSTLVFRLDFFFNSNFNLLCTSNKDEALYIVGLHPPTDILRSNIARSCVVRVRQLSICAPGVSEVSLHRELTHCSGVKWLIRITGFINSHLHLHDRLRAESSRYLMPAMWTSATPTLTLATTTLV